MAKWNLSAAVVMALLLVSPAGLAIAEQPETGQEPRARLKIDSRPDPAIRNVTKLLVDSKQAYRRLAETSGSTVPLGVRQTADCIAVVPLGMPSSLIGRRRVQGVLSCKDPRGVWSFPAVVNAVLPRHEGWFVPSDVVVYMRGQEVQRALAGSSIVLGTDLGAEPGPRGKTAAGLAITDWNGAYWYSRARGDYGGLELSDDPESNQMLYGPGVGRDAILANDGEISAPAVARELKDALG